MSTDQLSIQEMIARGKILAKENPHLAAYMINQPYTPDDYLSPHWGKYNRPHNWRNYVSSEVAVAWNSFTDQQKAMIARMCYARASMEELD
jgi:hypothetical protein